MQRCDWKYNWPLLAPRKQTAAPTGPSQVWCGWDWPEGRASQQQYVNLVQRLSHGRLGVGRGVEELGMISQPSPPSAIPPLLHLFPRVVLPQIAQLTIKAQLSLVPGPCGPWH